VKGVSGSAMAESYRANRVLVWVSLVTFENQMGFGAIVPVIALYAQSFGVSQAAIGLSLSVYGFARFLANVPTGQLADRIGRRMTLVLGEVVIVVAGLLYILAGHRNPQQLIPSSHVASPVSNGPTFIAVLERGYCSHTLATQVFP